MVGRAKPICWDDNGTPCSQRSNQSEQLILRGNCEKNGPILGLEWELVGEIVSAGWDQRMGPEDRTKRGVGGGLKHQRNITGSLKTREGSHRLPGRRFRLIPLPGEF